MRPSVHAARTKAVSADRRERARAREGLFPGQYRSGPDLLTVKTDLLYLELVAPELVTPARERESQMSGGTVTLPFLVQVDLLDDKYQVSIGLENLKFVLGDEVARKVRKEMNKLDAQRDADRREERRAARRVEEESE